MVKVTDKYTLGRFNAQCLLVGKNIKYEKALQRYQELRHMEKLNDRQKGAFEYLEQALKEKGLL